ncbi:MAG TPA: HipA domain-containing protein [Fimbriimonas sp.]|nr:HipA domain-containing protein [Fimbriimonas sp.]
MPDADIYQGSELVGQLERTLRGSRLTLIDGVTLKHGFLATTVANETLEGVELPPFFLNLLPEGARLQLLLESARSKDDSLGLLLRVGWDTIGDVAVLPHGEAPGAHMALARSSNLGEANFWDLFYAGVTAKPDGSVPGVQEKISASTVAFGVRAAGIPSAILKLNPPKYPRLVQNEEFFLRMARACGLEVNRAVIVYDRAGEAGLLVTRFDRVKSGSRIEKLHQEDGCQLLGSPPSNKYHLPLRAVADKIAELCTSGVVEVERLLRLIAFSYMIGNCDLHGKNISLIWDAAVRLSPGYDLVSTLPYTFLDRHMAMKLEGKDDNFKSGDFIDFGRHFGIPERATREMLSSLCVRAEPWIVQVEQIGFDANATAALQKEMVKRIGHLRR